MTHDEYVAFAKALFAKPLAERLDEAARTTRF